MVSISGLDEFVGKELVFKLRWIDLDDESFYTKEFIITPNKSTALLKSAISVTPGKRFPGEYGLQVYMEGELISEQKFYLTK